MILFEGVPRPRPGRAIRSISSGLRPPGISLLSLTRAPPRGASGRRRLPATPPAPPPLAGGLHLPPNLGLDLRRLPEPPSPIAARPSPPSCRESSTRIIRTRLSLYQAGSDLPFSRFHCRSRTPSSSARPRVFQSGTRSPRTELPSHLPRPRPGMYRLSGQESSAPCGPNGPGGEWGAGAHAALHFRGIGPPPAHGRG